MDQKLKVCLERLKSAYPGVIVPPSETRGLREAADMAESIFRKRQDVFWNAPERARSRDDAVFLGMTLSLLKKRGGQRGICEALEIIGFLEKQNA